MDVVLENSWKEALRDEFQKEYFKNLTEFIKDEYTKTTVYPLPKNIFRSLDECPIRDVAVVILGQDPYHSDVYGKPQAQGFSFSVPSNFPLPPSLRNIYKELKDDLKVTRTDGDLSDWATQGVLLLNATLTVRAHQAGSHQKKGWEQFTDKIIQTISEKNEHVVFILWGSYARSKKPLINQSKHCILEAPHPSPLSAHRGFFGSKPFSKTNDYLKKQGKKPIRW